MPEITGTLKPPRLAAAPGSPVKGQMYFNTAMSKLLWWDGAAWVDPSNDAVQLYVQSRGLNLITNGSGFLNNNYNFSGFTFDPVETHGGGGSFRININTDSRFSDEAIALDTSQTWVLTAWGKSGDANGANYNANNRQFLGIASFDIDGNLIQSVYAARHPGSVNTTLAVALNPGNTTVTLTDATGWSNAGSAASRSFAWWPYVNSKGYSYPAYGYSRNLTAYDSWATGAISGNVITLRTPWAGPALPAGTPVRNTLDGGTYKYIAAAYVPVPNVWTRFQGYLSGVDTLGDNIVDAFFAGTAFVRLVFLVNYHGAADNNLRWSDLSLESQFDTRFGNFNVNGTLSVSGSLNTGTFVNMPAAGVINIGDTNLYRAEANTLRTDDDLIVAYRLRVGTVDRQYGQLNLLTHTAAADGIGFGSDVNLYRHGADMLRTDDQLWARDFASDSRAIDNVAFSARASGDSWSRWYVTNRGQVVWGDGTASGDVSLYRDAANILRTDDDFRANNLRVGSGASVFFGNTGIDDRITGVASDSMQFWLGGLIRAEFNNAGQLVFGGHGGDTNLYRAGAGRLRTDETFEAGDHIKAGGVVDANSGQNAQVRLQDDIGDGSGKASIYFGSAYDTNLYRNAANVLKTDDTFECANLLVNGQPISGGGSAQWISGSGLPGGGIVKLGDLITPAPQAIAPPAYAAFTIQLTVPAGGVPVGSLVVIGGTNMYGGNITNATDPKGNNYIVRNNVAENTLCDSLITTALAAGDKISVNFNGGSGPEVALWGAYFSGIRSTNYSAMAGSYKFNAAATTWTSYQITPSEPGCLAILQGTSAYSLWTQALQFTSVPAGWTNQPGNGAHVAGVDAKVDWASAIIAGTDPFTASVGVPQSASGSVSVFLYRPAVASPPVGTWYLDTTTGIAYELTGSGWVQRTFTTQIPSFYSVTAGYTKDRTFNPQATTLNEVAATLGTLIDDMKAAGLITKVPN